MAVTEKHRHGLFNEVERVLGERRAETLMELLPPVGWADVATKHDVDTAIGSLRSEMATKSDIHALRRDVIGWLLTAMGIRTAVAGLLFTVGGG
jgi:hypothetical protein